MIQPISPRLRRPHRLFCDSIFRQPQPPVQLLVGEQLLELAEEPDDGTEDSEPFSVTEKELEEWGDSDWISHHGFQAA